MTSEERKHVIADGIVKVYNAFLLGVGFTLGCALLRHFFHIGIN